MPYPKPPSTNGAKPLRIAYLVQHFAPEIGASPARVLEMTRHWRDAGAEITILTGMPHRPEGRIHDGYRGRLFLEEQWQGMRVLRSWLYASPRPGFGRTVVNNVTFMATSLAHAFRALDGADVLIASSPPFLPHLAGDLIGRGRRVPVVLELRDMWPDYLVGMGMIPRGRLADALFAAERYVLHRAAHTVVVTESFRRRVIGKGVAPDRVTVVPNGIDPAQYHPSEEPAPIPALERRGPDDFIVGYLGNFGAGQALSTVLDAAALLADRAPDVRFVIAGDGPDRAALEQRVAGDGRLGNGRPGNRRPGDGRNVTLHGTVRKEDTRAFYNACDVVLVPLAPFPVLQETVPSKIFEALGCGRPVLASLSGEGERIMADSGGGLAVPPGDAAAMAEGILDLQAMDPAERHRRGQAAAAWVRERYDRQRLALRYLEVLQGVKRET